MTLQQELIQWRNRFRLGVMRNDDRQAKLLSQAIDRIKGAEELLSRNDVGNVGWWRDRDEFLANAKSSINAKDVLICMIDEWNDGEKLAFDCHITGIRKDGVDVCYLSGYRSRNDFVPWEDVVAKVDKSRPWVKLEIGFSGHFEVFQHNVQNSTTSS